MSSENNQTEVEKLCLRSICAHMRQLAVLEFEPDEICTPDAAATIAVSTGNEEYVPFLLAHGASQATVDRARENKAAFDKIRAIDASVDRAESNPVLERQEALVRVVKPMLDCFQSLPNKQVKTELALEIFRLLIQYKDALQVGAGIALHATAIAKLRQIIDQEADEVDKPRFMALEAELAACS